MGRVDGDSPLVGTCNADPPVHLEPKDASMKTPVAEPKPAPTDSPPQLLDVSSVSKSFGGVHAVKEMSLSLRPGELRAIIGPNGAGKSTLFSIIAGRLIPNTGSIRLREEDIDALPPHIRARRGISIMYQNPPAFPGLTVLQSVMLGAHRLGRTGFIRAILSTPGQRREERNLREAAVDALEMLGLSSLAHRQTTELTFGQLRRVQLARALASKPELLLLDEPASGLHRGERTEFGKVLQKLHSEGLSMMLIEHDVDLVMSVADSVTVMNLGAKLAEGTPAEIQSNPDVISAYLGEVVSRDGSDH